MYLYPLDIAFCGLFDKQCINCILTHTIFWTFHCIFCQIVENELMIPSNYKFISSNKTYITFDFMNRIYNFLNEISKSNENHLYNLCLKKSDHSIYFAFINYHTLIPTRLVVLIYSLSHWVIVHRSICLLFHYIKDFFLIYNVNL